MESSRIFVKNLPPSINDADFRKHFTARWPLTDVKVIPRRRIGYVGFESPQAAQDAVNYFNRSFIKLSRISVEVARSITDPSLPRHRAHGSGHGVESRPGPSKSAPTPIADDKSQENSKKRKREAVDQSDPKFKEYLEVMNPKVRGGEDTTDQAKSAQASSPEPEAIEVDEASDDEYESIPKRPTKVRIKETDLSASSNLGALPSTETPDDPVPRLANPPSPPVLAQDATDDDFLRSRTNRLLSVEPEDAISTRAPVPSNPPAQEPSAAQGDDDEEPDVSPDAADADAGEGSRTHAQSDDSVEDSIRKTSRLFLRNLRYNVKEEDIEALLGKYGEIDEINLPTGSSGQRKGYAMIHFANAEEAVAAFQNIDGQPFQGRILHVLPAKAKRETQLDEYALSKLPLKRQQQIRRKAAAASNTFNWNSLYMSQDAVNASVAHRMGITKAELLDPTSSDAAVKQAISETEIIQETKAYFLSHGVNIDAFKSQKKRGETVLLLKGFPFGTTLEELRLLCEEGGAVVLRVVMPPSGTIAIAEFAQPAQCKTAFAKLSYRRFKESSIIFVEYAPVGTLTEATAPITVDRQPAVKNKVSATELLEGDQAMETAGVTSSLYVSNLNFATTSDSLAEAFAALDGFVSARVKTKVDKKGQVLSMGFGFVEFRSKEHAAAAATVMDGRGLQGHALRVKASHRGLDAVEERKRDATAAEKTKIVIKNVPFETNKKDIRTLLSTYGQVRSVRMPKKFGNATRGFAFAEFVSSREAANALASLKDTHLLGRKLVLQYAEQDAVDAEEEIAKMQKKVEGQVRSEALHRLTGTGRRKINLDGAGNDEEA